MVKIMRRRIATVVAIAYAWSLLFAQVSSVQAADCSYDESAPSISNARTSFQIFDFECAEAELQDVLKQSNLSTEQRANAHMLLAAVYFEMFQGESQSRTKIRQQFEEAFTAYRDWKGKLDIQSPEFRQIMEEARAAVEAKQKKDEPKQPVIARDPAGSSGSEKGGSKKWLLIGLGAVAVVGGIALAAGGGGGDGGGGGVTGLPDFPDHP